MTKEGYQPIKKETIKIIPPNTGSHVYMKKDSYTWKDMDRSYWEGFDTAKGKIENRIAELEKENAELKAKVGLSIVKGALTREKRIEELEKEINDLAKVAYMQGADSQKKKTQKQLIKAKEILREYIRINLLPPIERKFDDEVKLFKQSEQFLKEVSE